MRALKEWAAAVEALLDGAQTALVRKGGILDVPSGFRIAAGDEFALYPTYEHQEAAHVKDSARRYLDRALSGRNRSGGGGAVVLAYARVEAEADVSSDAAFEALSPLHVWSDSYIAARRAWQPDRPAKAAHLRVYRLREALEVPDSPEYGGCRSWIEVPGGPAGRGSGGEAGAGAAPGMAPALGDGAAAERLARFREAVAAG